jgi:hypothetical protein
MSVFFGNSVVAYDATGFQLINYNVYTPIGLPSIRRVTRSPAKSIGTQSPCIYQPSSSYHEFSTSG